MSEKSRAARAARFLVQFFDVVCQMTTFRRRREVIKGMNTSPILYNMSMVEKFHIAKSSSVLEWHFRCSSRCMFINSLLGNLSNHDYDGNKNLTNLHIWQWKTVFLHVHFFSSFDILKTLSFFLRREMTCFAVVWTTWAYDDKCSILSCYLKSAGSDLIPGQLVRTHFASAMTLNNCDIIEQTRSYIFRWSSRGRRCRLCLSSLIKSLENDNRDRNGNPKIQLFV